MAARNHSLMCVNGMKLLKKELAHRTGDGTLLTPIQPDNMLTTEQGNDEASSMTLLRTVVNETTKSLLSNVSTPGSSSRIMYPTSYADDIACIQKEMDAEDGWSSQAKPQ